ncbi:MAG: hypothetical protein KA035_02420 [Candidatus Levybacteria bacterium]|nr:hypothetical protein [Candidatus Levybacteria bacterium]
MEADRKPFDPRKVLSQQYSEPVVEVMGVLAHRAAIDTNLFQALFTLHMVKKAEEEVIEARRGLLEGQNIDQLLVEAKLLKASNIRKGVEFILEQNPEISERYTEADRVVTDVTVRDQSGSVNTPSLINAIITWATVLR